MSKKFTVLRTAPLFKKETKHISRSYGYKDMLKSVFTFPEAQAAADSGCLWLRGRAPSIPAHCCLPPRRNICPICVIYAAHTIQHILAQNFGLPGYNFCLFTLVGCALRLGYNLSQNDRRVWFLPFRCYDPFRIAMTTWILYTFTIETFQLNLTLRQGGRKHPSAYSEEKQQLQHYLHVSSLTRS